MPHQFGPSSRLRFAPSPTGTLHVGGARTALFNWLLARACGGAFVLRFEDTDRARSTQASVDEILGSMRWLGLDWDEGPHFQSERGAAYDAACAKLIERKKAYPCFCTAEHLDALRKEAQKAGRNFVYDGRCRDIDEGEVKRRIDEGEPHTLRFRLDSDSTTGFDDLIGGHRSFENDTLGDFVIRRSDGSPIYHLTVVVDDHTMGITHVVRGDDHLSNTPRQILIFEALGWPIPLYAHLPLIQGADRARLSKRHGATSISEFANEGFFAEAMVNYLALLGWSLDAETEILSRVQLVENFSLGRVNQSAAMFDRKKLEWMNGLYMRNKPLGEIADLVRDRLRTAGTEAHYLEDAGFAATVALEIERAKTLAEMEHHLAYFFTESIDAYDAKAAKKHFMKDGVEGLLEKVKKVIANADPFDAASLEPPMRDLAETEGVGFGKIVHPLRLALTGLGVSPGIFDVVEKLGRDRSLSRIRAAQEWIAEKKKNNNPETQPSS